MTNRRTYGIINLAFAGVAHLVERDLAKVEVASSSLVARSKNKSPSDRMGIYFWSVTVLLRKTGRLFIFSCLPLWGRWIAAQRQDERGEPDLGKVLPMASAEGHSPSVGFADSSLTEGAERTVVLRGVMVFGT